MRRTISITQDGEMSINQLIEKLNAAKILGFQDVEMDCILCLGNNLASKTIDLDSRSFLEVK